MRKNYLECCDTIAVLFIVEPLSFVFETVGSFTDAVSGSFIVLPFAHISLRNAGFQLFILSFQQNN